MATTYDSKKKRLHYWTLDPVDTWAWGFFGNKGYRDQPKLRRMILKIISNWGGRSEKWETVQLRDLELFTFTKVTDV